eukprot:51684-Eustigmatos_ZCMA.PRE.1
MRGTIYSIKCAVTGKEYIGSTVESIEKRMSVHKAHHHYWKDQTRDRISYCSSFEVLQHDDYTVTILEEIECQTTEELRQQEKCWVDMFETVNKNSLYQTYEEKLRYIN